MQGRGFLTHSLPSLMAWAAFCSGNWQGPHLPLHKDWVLPDWTGVGWGGCEAGSTLLRVSSETSNISVISTHPLKNTAKITRHSLNTEAFLDYYHAWTVPPIPLYFWLAFANTRFLGIRRCWGCWIEERPLCCQTPKNETEKHVGNILSWIWFMSPSGALQTVKSWYRL